MQRTYAIISYLLYLYIVLFDKNRSLKIIIDHYVKKLGCTPLHLFCQHPSKRHRHPPKHHQNLDRIARKKLTNLK